MVLLVPFHLYPYLCAHVGRVDKGFSIISGACRGMRCTSSLFLIMLHLQVTNYINVDIFV